MFSLLINGGGESHFHNDMFKKNISALPYDYVQYYNYDLAFN